MSFAISHFPDKHVVHIFGKITDSFACLPNVFWPNVFDQKVRSQPKCGVCVFWLKAIRPIQTLFKNLAKLLWCHIHVGQMPFGQMFFDQNSAEPTKVWCLCLFCWKPFGQYKLCSKIWPNYWVTYMSAKCHLAKCFLTKKVQSQPKCGVCVFWLKAIRPINTLFIHLAKFWGY